MKSTILFSLLLFTNLLCQIDTADYYPLHIGDKWEYYDMGNHDSYTVDITGDTIMPNGQRYYIIPYLGIRKYQRVEKNSYVKVYNEEAENEEVIEYDLVSNKGSINFSISNPCSGWGIYDVEVDNNNLLDRFLEWREYRLAYLDTTVIPPDTVWNHLVDLYWPRVTKGIGITSYSYGLSKLVGAVINKVGYGTLTDVNDEQETSPETFELYQNHPNPFNPSTILSYQVPSLSHVSLKIYDILGKEVATLVEDNQEMGKYSVQFNAKNLASGMYIYQIKAGDFISSKKLMLMK